jgi:hypothetical protein
MMMKTPYDAAIRVKRREVDAMGAAINVEMATLNQIDTRRMTVRAMMAREAAVAANDILMPNHAYMAKLRAEQVKLAGERTWHDIQLDRLRQEAASAFGSFRTIEIAAEDFRDDAQRRQDVAEQSELDDSCAAALRNARKVLRKGMAR